MNLVKQRQKEFEEVCRLLGIIPSGKLRIVYEAIIEKDEDYLAKLNGEGNTFYVKYKERLMRNVK